MTIHNADGCVFCDIVTGTEPATMVREWGDAIAFTPLNPVNQGHTLVIPRTHVPDAVTDPDATAATMRRASQFAGESEHSNIITSTGKPATQSIFHLHIHVVPRAVDDWLMLPWGTAGDPHAPHWCKVAQDLQDHLEDQTAAKQTAAGAADRFRDVVSEVLDLDENPGDDLLVEMLRDRHGKTGPEPRRWRDFMVWANAQRDQINAERSEQF